MKIAVASGKGGVGKSMLASALAMLFSKDRQIVAVDCDVDAPNLHLWLGEPDAVAHFSARPKKREINFASAGWSTVEKISTSERPVIDYGKCDSCGKCVEMCQFGALKMEEGKPELNPFLCEGCGACQVICPKGAITMDPVENAEVRIKNDIHGFPLVSAQLYPGEKGSGKIVDEIVREAEKFEHEIMILDSPAGTGCPVIATLKNADFAVLVTEPTPAARADLQRVLAVVDYFQIPFGVVINKWDINKDLTGRIELEFGDKVLGKINYDKRVFEAISRLTPIMQTRLPIKAGIEAIFHRIIERGLIQ